MLVSSWSLKRFTNYRLKTKRMNTFQKIYGVFIVKLKLFSGAKCYEKWFFMSPMSQESSYINQSAVFRLRLGLGLGLGFGLGLGLALELELALRLSVFFSQVKHFDSWLIDSWLKKTSMFSCYFKLFLVQIREVSESCSLLLNFIGYQASYFPIF